MANGMFLNAFHRFDRNYSHKKARSLWFMKESQSDESVGPIITLCHSWIPISKVFGLFQVTQQKNTHFHWTSYQGNLVNGPIIS